VDIFTDDKKRIHEQEASLKTYKGEFHACQRERLKRSKVDAYLKVVAATTGLLPAPHIYAEFYLGEDGRTLYLKNGTRVTQLKDSTKYLALKSIGSDDYISTHLFPNYIAGQHGGSLYPPERKPIEALSWLIYHNMHLTSTPLLSSYSQRLALTPTVPPTRVSCTGRGFTSSSWCTY